MRRTLQRSKPTPFYLLEIRLRLATMFGAGRRLPRASGHTLGRERVRVVNLATRGYGVDQMWLKLITMAGRYQPNIIVFSYIPHDLLRPASDFNFGLPKPRLGLQDNKPNWFWRKTYRTTMMAMILLARVST